MVRVIVIVASFLVLFGIGASGLVRDIHNQRDVKGWLELAASAPTVERADEFLGKAIDGIERKGWTSGNSALFFRNPDMDLAIWYSQITGAKATTSDIMGRDATQLERDNALMKIREVLTEDGEKGTKIDCPGNLTWFPGQLGIFCIAIFAGLALSVALGACMLDT